MRQEEPVHVGRYVRDLGASLARLFENALDWEHLPHQHKSSFASIRLIAADASGWRAETTAPDDPRPLTLDLRLDRIAGVWATRTTQGQRLLSETRTQAEATGPRSSRVTVDFHVAGAPEARHERIGAYFHRLYARLYDEDEAMMIARQAALDGGAADTRWRTVQLSDGEYRVPTACPHLGLPLRADPDADGIITCPWHGYRFDARTGRCVSGRSCAWKVKDSP